MTDDNVTSEKSFLVYKYTCIPTGKLYFGQTCNPTARRWSHRHSPFCTALKRAADKHGWDNFLYEVIKDGLTVEEANVLESALIEEYDTLAPNGYNLRVGGDNRRLSAETRRKIGDANRGKKRSKEVRERMSEAARNRGPVAPATGAKISKALKGRTSPTKGKKLPPRSPEHLAKLSAAKIGANNPNFGKNKTPTLTSIEGNKDATLGSTTKRK